MRTLMLAVAGLATMSAGQALAQATPPAPATPVPALPDSPPAEVVPADDMRAMMREMLAEMLAERDARGAPQQREPQQRDWHGRRDQGWGGGDWRGPGPGMHDRGMRGGAPFGPRGHGMHRAGAQVAFAIMDADGDGVLTMDEVTAFHLRLFNAFDQDGDGGVTVDEMNDMLRGGRG